MGRVAHAMWGPSHWGLPVHGGHMGGSTAAAIWPLCAVALSVELSVLRLRGPLAGGSHGPKGKSLG